MYITTGYYSGDVHYNVGRLLSGIEQELFNTSKCLPFANGDSLAHAYSIITKEKPVFINQLKEICKSDIEPEVQEIKYLINQEVE